MTKKLFFLVLLLLLPQITVSAETFHSFIDSTGRKIELKAPPKRVVSLVPSVSEIIMKIGAGDHLIGTTHHSVLPAGMTEKTIIGGFFAPDLDKVSELTPDLIFYSSLQDEVVDHFQGKVVLVSLQTNSIAQSYEHITLLGKIFAQQQNAEKIVREQKRLLKVMSGKVEKIPKEKRKRVMRLMGRQRVMTPGDDSFQNEYIRMAGGIPPQLGRNGAITKMSLEEWQAFNPQVLYGCGGDRSLLEKLDLPGWKEVEAVKNKAVYFFPCDLTCRAATNTGYFVSWLGANIYGDEFSKPENFVLKEKIVSQRDIEVDVSYVTEAEIIESEIKDFRNRTVLLSLKEPMTILSSLEGWKNNIVRVGNHYFPPPSWGLGHKQGLAGLRETTSSVLGIKTADSALLFTGADMNNLAIVKKAYRDIEVTALVTAGVAGNAVRMGGDVGLFYEPDTNPDRSKPGTINTLLFTNTQLSQRAMTRALISATEAKSAALQDLDIRSSYTSATNPATGTGTDNILVVEGRGVPIDASGGHTKMGELIAKAVYQALQQAVFNQNGFSKERSLFQRLRERKVNLRQLGRQCLTDNEPANKLEKLLLNSEFSSFLKGSLAISDAYEKGLIADLSSFDQWCNVMALKAGNGSREKVRIKDDTIPLVLRKALEALLGGLNAREEK